MSWAMVAIGGASLIGSTVAGQQSRNDAQSGQSSMMDFTNNPLFRQNYIAQLLTGQPGTEYLPGAMTQGMTGGFGEIPWGGAGLKAQELAVIQRIIDQSRQAPLSDVEQQIMGNAMNRATAQPALSIQDIMAALGRAPTTASAPALDWGALTKQTVNDAFNALAENQATRGITPNSGIMQALAAQEAGRTATSLIPQQASYNLNRQQLGMGEKQLDINTLLNLLQNQQMQQSGGEATALGLSGLGRSRASVGYQDALNAIMGGQNMAFQQYNNQFPSGQTYAQPQNQFASALGQLGGTAMGAGLQGWQQQNSMDQLIAALRGSGGTGVGVNTPNISRR